MNNNVLQLTYIILIFSVSPVHHFEQLHLNLGLIEEGFLVLYYLDGDMALFFMVERLHHLTKWTFSYEGIYFVSIEELFTVLYDVIMVIVIIAIVVQLPLFLVRAVFTLCLGRPTLFLCVINLQEKYVFNFVHTAKVACLFAKHWQHYWSLRLFSFLKVVWNIKAPT